MKNKRARQEGKLDDKIFLVIKFWLMSVFQGAALIIIVFLLGTVDALGLLMIGIVLFIASLVITRRFDKSITSLAVRIAKKLGRHPRIRKALISNI